MCVVNIRGHSNSNVQKLGGSAKSLQILKEVVGGKLKAYAHVQHDNSFINTLYFVQHLKDVDSRLL